MRLIPALVFCAVAIAGSARAEDPIDRFVMEFVAVAPNHPLYDADARRQYVTELRRTAAWWQVPPEILAVVHRLESAYRIDVIGARGEIGIAQVHPSMANGCELRTRAGQMACGAKLLRGWHDKCGTWRGALTAYAQKSGNCTADSPAVRRKVNYRMRMIDKVKNEN